MSIISTDLRPLRAARSLEESEIEKMVVATFNQVLGSGGRLVDAYLAAVNCYIFLSPPERDQRFRVRDGIPRRTGGDFARLRAVEMVLRSRDLLRESN